MNGRRALVGCWAVLAGGALTGAALLQLLGAPHAATARSAQAKAAERVASAPSTARARVPVPVPAGTVAPPDPLLEAAIADQPGRFLPVIAQDGRRASVLYRAPCPAVLPGQARVALLVDGVGLDHAASLAAIAELPGPVSLAFSPYAGDVEALEAAARAHGHEMLVSIPMEPQGAPESDEGDRQLSAVNDGGTNTRNLLWALSALRGYVGATGADTGQSGEHYEADPGGFGEVVRTVAAHGLIYVDPRPAGAAASGAGTNADVMIGGGTDLSALGAQLSSLVAVAQRDGRAVGVAGPLRPTTLARLVAWTRTLPAQGVVLVPVSSLGPTASAQTATASAAP